MIRLLFVFLLSMNVYAGNLDCADRELLGQGFTFHDQDSFEQDVADVTKWLESEDARFTLDIEELTWSFIYGEYVTLTSMDTPLTSSREMLGDVVIIRDDNTKEILEVRWYKNGEKHLSYDRTKQRCATNLVPIPMNSLF